MLLSAYFTTVGAALMDGTADWQVRSKKVAKTNTFFKNNISTNNIIYVMFQKHRNSNKVLRVKKRIQNVLKQQVTGTLGEKK